MWLVWPLAGLAALIITALAVLARRRGQATTNAALKRAGIGWGHVAAVELNDAFAAQSVACIKAWGIDPEIVNAHGGAICPWVIYWARRVPAFSVPWRSLQASAKRSCTIADGQWRRSRCPFRVFATPRRTFARCCLLSALLRQQSMPTRQRASPVAAGG
jgi:hypothetical protein